MQALNQDQLMGELLGVDSPHISSFDILNEVGEGIKIANVKSLAKYLFPTQKTSVDNLVARATFARAKKRVSPQVSEKIYDVAKVYSLALLIYNQDYDKASQFLSKPHQGLGGKSPFDMAKQSTAGADIAASLLEQIRAGVAL
ncbi:MAG: hypothetical protein COB24_06915 [Hyphomicrobiales bacterium]|nr:MAG: hypothetical protein COB24_06915 [Hyphomicrobiales bacterium]